MIDLHSHILPACDDGAPDMQTALAMARMAVNDGLSIVACTPHILSGLYDNDALVIQRSLESLRDALRNADIDLHLVAGAEIHIAPDLPRTLASGDVPTLNGSRYFLLEAPRHVVPPRFVELVGRIMSAGFRPIIVHPERMTWIDAHYDVFARVNAMGCLVQITASSVTGEFGRTARYYADRMLDEGRVDIIATDAHNDSRRPPILSKARNVLEPRFGKDEVDQMVLYRPAKILLNQLVTAAGVRKRIRTENVSPPSGLPGMLGRVFGGWA